MVNGKRSHSPYYYYAGWGALLWLGVVLLLGRGVGTAQSKTDAALTLLEASSARAASLGQAFSAVADDVTAFSYNPALLSSLQSRHASFLFQQGISDDSYGQFQIGIPVKRASGFGLTVGYYDGGSITVFDSGGLREITAQEDVMINMGYGVGFGKTSWGLTAKYFSTELADTDSATAVAGDAGFALAVHPRLRLGAAVQNIGTELKFDTVGDELPRIARLGASVVLVANRVPTQFFLDVPYHFNQEEYRPGVGLEVLVGPLAFRTGYKRGSDLEKFSFGAGFFLGQLSFDYAFGLVEQLEDRHQLNVSMRFGSRLTAPDLVQKPATKEKRVVVEITDPIPGPRKGDNKIDLGEAPLIRFPVQEKEN